MGNTVIQQEYYQETKLSGRNCLNAGNPWPVMETVITVLVIQVTQAQGGCTVNAEPTCAPGRGPLLLNSA